MVLLAQPAPNSPICPSALSKSTSVQHSHTCNHAQTPLDHRQVCTHSIESALHMNFTAHGLLSLVSCVLANQMRTWMHRPIFCECTMGNPSIMQPENAGPTMACFVDSPHSSRVFDIVLNPPPFNDGRLSGPVEFAGQGLSWPISAWYLHYHQAVAEICLVAGLVCLRKDRLRPHCPATPFPAPSQGMTLDLHDP